MSQTSGRKTSPTSRFNSPTPVENQISWRTFDPELLPQRIESPLARELVTFRDRLDELLADHEGEFLVVKDDRIIGFYPDRSAAVEVVFREFGSELALIQQVVEFQPIRSF